MKVNEPSPPEGMTAASIHAAPIHQKVILNNDERNELSRRSDKKGMARLLGHIFIMVCSGAIYGWIIFSKPTGVLWSSWILSLPFMSLLGFTYATMFACMHESIHRTAFKNRKLNDVTAWVAGFLAFYNSAFFKISHGWHHRYTQIPGKDPELDEPKPTTKMEYLLEISSLLWWYQNCRNLLFSSLGNFDEYPYIPKSAYSKVVRSTWLQILAYTVLIIGSVILVLTEVTHLNLFLVFWCLPMAAGQPFLRVILLADHTACTVDSNALTNTRTTYTLPIVRFLMWEMPFHAEHHRYPHIPFHALAKTHERLKPHLRFVMEDGFWGAQRQIICELEENFIENDNGDKARR